MFVFPSTNSFLFSSFPSFIPNTVTDNLAKKKWVKDLKEIAHVEADMSILRISFLDKIKSDSVIYEDVEFEGDRINCETLMFALHNRCRVAWQAFAESLFIFPFFSCSFSFSLPLIYLLFVCFFF